MPVLDETVEESSGVPDVRHIYSEFQAIQDAPAYRQRNGCGLAVNNELLCIRFGVVRIIHDVEAHANNEAPRTCDRRSLKCGQTVDLEKRVVVPQRKTVDGLVVGNRC